MHMKSATSLLLRLVYLNVRNIKCIPFQAFNLCIALSILKQVENEFCRFGGLATLSIGMSILRLSSPSYTTTKARERYGLFVAQQIL